MALRMKLLTFGVLVPISLTTLSGQDPQQTVRTELTCVESMTIPQPEGRFRYIGSARVLITVGADGAQAKIAVQTDSSRYGEFEAWLWASLQDTRFSAKCAGQTIEVNFEYGFRGAAGRDPQSTIRLKNSNTFEIISNRPLAQA
jgi:hypothetical protein